MTNLVLKKTVCSTLLVLSVGWFAAKSSFNIRAVTSNGVSTNNLSQTNTQQSQPTVETAERDKAIAKIKERIAGRENDTAEQVFRNIEILKGKKASVLPGMMSALTGLLGVNCTYCHIQDQWDREDKPTKQIARKMFQMVKTINRDNFDGRNAVSCWTCHRGNPHPPIK
ncbi:MAG TPA: c-type cytochrome [Pyrinomonadaceae bacterium]|nr:c-type cytochrome [Pyrinomonadaceae bacterium]